MSAITLEQANTIIQAALRKGREIDCEPLTVAVLDPGGHLVALAREDGSGIIRPLIAQGKAWGVLGMGLPARDLMRRAEKMPAFFNALSDMSGGRMVPVPGGVLIRDAQGTLLGSVGITGDTSDRDEECALAGVEAAGLVGEVDVASA